MKKQDLWLAIVVMAIWGFNFSMIKMGVTHVNPLITTAVRFLLAVIPAIFFISRPQVAWRYLIAYGVVFGVGIWGMASWSISAGLSSGIASILLSGNVLIGMVVGIVIYRETLTPAKVVGALLALVALATLVLAASGNITMKGLILISISACSWTLMSVIIKSAKTTQAFAFNVWGMLFAPVPLVLFAVAIHGPAVLSQALVLWDWHTSLAVAFQAYPTTLFGYWVWNKIVIQYPLSTVSPLPLLVPVFAMVSGFFFFAETLTWPQIFASGLFLLGIGLILKPLKQKRVKDNSSEIKAPVATP